MKRTLTLLILLLSAVFAKAQNKDTIAKTPEIFSPVEVSAEFPGGIEGLYKFQLKNIRYPKSAKKENIQGKVFLSFTVEKDGSLTDFKIEKSLSTDLDAEAMRVMQLSPKWHPAQQNNQPVRQRYTLPVMFKLDN